MVVERISPPQYYEDDINALDGRLTTAEGDITTLGGDVTTLEGSADTATAHIASTSNPHAVTKTQAGLSNVLNTDATARANHTGTQAISTITGLQDALDALNLRPVTTKTANYTATASDYTIRVDATAGAVTITLPVTAVGKVFEIEKIDNSANDVIVDADGTDVINIPGTGPALTATLSDQFSLLIVKCTVVNSWTWISAVGTVT